ncbi:hypothetical protein HHL17_06090 [Chitinophaga sp. G-6-1-13]|uniref:Uncharacterized protein n=1 Tax=Chitinophaga fulva TaxID=2728842 RepID=A0A848GDM3_9BACT|nr:hypothetical protein [Chitinophaga fulva]NML36765.1 hypothetical protein [Chitinophaga fulva]
MGTQDVIRLTPGKEICATQHKESEGNLVNPGKSGYERIKDIPGSPAIENDLSAFDRLPATLYQKGSYQLVIQVGWVKQTRFYFLVLTRDSAASKKISEKN